MHFAKELNFERKSDWLKLEGGCSKWCLKMGSLWLRRFEEDSIEEFVGDFVEDSIAN